MQFTAIGESLGMVATADVFLVKEWGIPIWNRMVNNPKEWGIWYQKCISILLTCILRESVSIFWATVDPQLQLLGWRSHTSRWADRSLMILDFVQKSIAPRSMCLSYLIIMFPTPTVPGYCIFIPLWIMKHSQQEPAVGHRRELRWKVRAKCGLWDPASKRAESQGSHHWILGGGFHQCG